MQRLQGGQVFLFPRCRKSCPEPQDPQGMRQFSRWKKYWRRLRTPMKFPTEMFSLSRQEASETVILHRLTHRAAWRRHTTHIVSRRPDIFHTETLWPESRSQLMGRRLLWETCTEVKKGKAELLAAAREALQGVELEIPILCCPGNSRGNIPQKTERPCRGMSAQS